MSDPVLTSLLRINRRRMVALRRVLTPQGYVGFMHLIPNSLAFPVKFLIKPMTFAKQS